MEEIKFKKVGDMYGEFSNFYISKIDFEGFRYNCSEVLFQSQKFYVEGDTDQDRIEYYNIICNCDSPMKAKILGQRIWRNDLDLWLELKLELIL